MAYKVSLAVTEGSAKFYPGLFSKDDERVDAVWTRVVDLVPDMPEPTPVKSADMIDSLIAWVEELYNKIREQAKADLAAPGLGSASRLFNRVYGRVKVTALELPVLVRVYNEKNPWGEASLGNLYLDAFTQEPTSKSWAERVLYPGESIERKVIEDNAITLQVYPVAEKPVVTPQQVSPKKPRLTQASAVAT